MSGKNADKTKSIMLAAGGTGGHLFPAMALAQELDRRGFAVDLITDMRGDRYRSDFPARKIYRVPAATLVSRSPAAVAKTAAMLARGTLMAWRILGKVKPAALAGFGGYPTFPPIMAARYRRIPAILHEQNAVMGRANRMLAKHVSAIATSFSQVKYLSEDLVAKTRFTGNPVRDEVIALAGSEYHAPGDNETFRLLVFGGSQGARYFSDSVPPALEKLPEDLRHRLALTQQCRAEDIERVRGAYEKIGIKSKLATFFAKLPQIVADSHLVIARAGASTVAELAVLGRPSLLVPLPHSLDNDQLQNALMLAEGGGAWYVAQEDLDAGSMAERLAALMKDPARLTNAARAARSFGRPDAVKQLADLVVEIAGS